ncbi:sialin-like isoform X2 [Oppia nitens]|nr:sialin-like isoform X2 [Oppia nitens]
MYLITPTISGRITERFGAKWMTALTIMISGSILALIPTAAHTSVELLITLLVIQGLFHGCVFASLFSLYANWFTASERSYAISGIAAGSNFGNLVTFPLAGYLSNSQFAGGWPSVFYIVCMAHIPWLILWILCVEDTPLKSSRSRLIKCSADELAYIQTNINSFGAPKSSSRAPWIKILTSRCVWSSIIWKISAGWGYYLLLSKMPSYLDKVFGLSLLQNGLFNAMTSLATGLTMAFCGPLSAFIIRKASPRLSKTAVRKIFASIALLGPASCLALITALGCNSQAVITLLIMALFLYGFMTGGEFTIISEFAPDFSGTVFGIAATISVFPAFVAPYVVGIILGDKPGEIGRWNLVFYITIAIYILGTVVFVMFASAEPQEWGLIDKVNRKKRSKSIDIISKDSMRDAAQEILTCVER